MSDDGPGARRGGAERRRALPVPADSRLRIPYDVISSASLPAVERWSTGSPLGRADPAARGRLLARPGARELSPERVLAGPFYISTKPGTPRRGNVPAAGPRHRHRGDEAPQGSSASSPQGGHRRAAPSDGSTPAWSDRYEEFEPTSPKPSSCTRSTGPAARMRPSRAEARISILGGPPRPPDPAARRRSWGRGLHPSGAPCGVTLNEELGLQLMPGCATFTAFPAWSTPSQRPRSSSACRPWSLRTASC